MSLTLCFLLMVTELALGVPQCKNGGTVEENLCVCPPYFTGANCEATIYSEQQKIEKKLEIQECFGEDSPVSTETGSASGSGSGEGSAMEAEEKKIVECPDAEKRRILGSCELVNSFEGRILLARTEESLGLHDESTPGYRKYTEQAECVLEKIFADLGYIELNVKKLMEDAGNVAVDYVMKSSKNVTSKILKDVISSALSAAGDIIEAATVRDINECEGNNSCEQDCENTDGSYICSCKFNFTDATSDDRRPNSRCRHVCNDTEGKEYCINGGKCSISLDGRGICECPLNYAGKRCEREWFIFLNATVGLTAALGVVLVIFVIVTLMLRVRNRIKSSSKSDFLELESNSANGEFNVTNETNEIKGISNPYVSSDEGITVAMKADDDAPAIEDDKL